MDGAVGVDTSSVSRDDISIVDGEFWGRNPETEMAWMRANEPVFRDRTGVWGVSRYHDLKTVSTNPDLFSSAHGIRPDSDGTPMMIDTDAPTHVRRRKLVNAGFTPRRVRDQEPDIREMVDTLIDSVCEQGECDLVWDLAAWLPLIVIGDALGVEPPDRQQLLTWSDDLLKGQGSDDPERLDAMMAAFAGYADYASRVMADRRERPRDDLMSVLVHAEVDGDRLSDDDILYDSLLILIGGDETTRHVISGGAYQLLSERSRWQALLDDRSLLPTAIEEMLRWVSPIKNMARTATRDTRLADRDIEEGDKLLLLYPSANRDEAVFDDPFSFDIRRDPNEHVAFGFGPHFCLGNNLARLELRTMFEQLLERLPDLHLVDDAEPERRPANFVSGYESMRVAFTPTAPRS